MFASKTTLSGHLCPFSPHLNDTLRVRSLWPRNTRYLATVNISDSSIGPTSKWSIMGMGLWDMSQLWNLRRGHACNRNFVTSGGRRLTTTDLQSPQWTLSRSTERRRGNSHMMSTTWPNVSKTISRKCRQVRVSRKLERRLARDVGGKLTQSTFSRRRMVTDVNTSRNGTNRRSHRRSMCSGTSWRRLTCGGMVESELMMSDVKESTFWWLRATT